jgi:hypothetical protein
MIVVSPGRYRLSWIFVWWACVDLNHGPLPYQGVEPGSRPAVVSL